MGCRSWFECRYEKMPKKHKRFSPMFPVKTIILGFLSKTQVRDKIISRGTIMTFDDNDKGVVRAYMIDVSGVRWY